MNAGDLSCTENLSANVGKRGDRGITGPKGSPGTYGPAGVPGQPGPSGSSRIDITMQGENPFVSVSSIREQTVAYIHYPGSTSWGGDIQNIKIGCSYNTANIVSGSVLSSEITLVDSTNSLDILSIPLQYTNIINSTTLGTKNFEIVSLGVPRSNNYVTIQNVPTGPAVLQVKIKTSLTINGVVSRTPSTLEVYAIELI